jgi:hypothetical protein
MTAPEAAILDARGIHVDHNPITLTCNQLVEGRCAIYDDRPLVCRLWGAIPTMRCPFGCEPPLTDEEGRALMRLMFTIEEIHS